MPSDPSWDIMPVASPALESPDIVTE